MKYDFAIFTNEADATPFGRVSANTLSNAKSAVMRAAKEVPNVRVYATDGVRCIVWHKTFGQCLGFYKEGNRRF